MKNVEDRMNVDDVKTRDDGVFPLLPPVFRREKVGMTGGKD